MQVDHSITVIDSELVEPERVIIKESYSPAFFSFKDKVIGISVVVSICGLLILAVIDSNYRPTFVALANTFVAGYVGVQVGKNR